MGTSHSSTSFRRSHECIRYPVETPKDFFLKVVDAQISFETDAQGRANALVLHQNGRDMRAKRME